jgi:exosortase
VDPQPLADVVRSRPWRLVVVVLLVGVGFAFHNAIPDMVRVWFTQADYSHGVLVPVVAGYLLYQRRRRFPPLVEWPEPLGLVPLLAGLAISVAAGTFNIAKEFGQGVGLILALTGVVLIVLGRPGLRWAWPGLAFLVFMVKLPDRIEILFTFKLRQIATQSSNFVLQTLGYPSYVAGPSGTVITVGDVRLGVEWACSGLSMVLTFVAMGAAFALLMRHRPLGDRVFVFASSIPIAILSNTIRIVATAIVYVAADNKDNVWKWIGDKIVHDLAGWLMMPLALGFLWLVLKAIDWLYVVPPPPERDEVLKVATAAAAASWVVPERADADDPDLAPKKPPTPGVPS